VDLRGEVAELLRERVDLLGQIGGALQQVIVDRRWGRCRFSGLVDDAARFAEDPMSTSGTLRSGGR